MKEIFDNTEGLKLEEKEEEHEEKGVSDFGSLEIGAIGLIGDAELGGGLQGERNGSADLMDFDMDL